jgi:hypothetical protein
MTERMYRMHNDRTSTDRQGRRILLHLVLTTAIAFGLVAGSVSAAPAHLKRTPAQQQTTANAAATSCVAKILKGGKLVDLYERYYKYKFKKLKGSKKYKRVIVRARRKLKTSCVRQCAKTKVKKGKRYPVYKTVKKKVTVKKKNRLVKAKRKVRVHVFEKCKVSSSSATGTPVKVTLLQGSVVNLDFGAFKREGGLTGQLTGFIPGGYNIGQDNQINLTRGNINLGQTNVFIDDDCNGGQVSAAIRTGTPTQVGLDGTRQSISTLTSAGNVTATVYTNIKLPLDLRNDDDGCNQPYITTGYSEFRQTFFVKGKIEKGTGLSKLKLTSPPDPLDVVACLSPGPPTSPCNGFQIPLPIIVSLNLTVKIDVG